MTINTNNYEQYLVDYLHGELSPALSRDMETFLAHNESARQEFFLLQKTILQKDMDITFDRKDSLYKHEKTPLLVYRRMKPALIAASLLAFILTFYFISRKENIQTTPDPLSRIDMPTHTTTSEHIQSHPESVAKTSTQTQARKAAILQAPKQANNTSLIIKKEGTHSQKKQIPLVAADTKNIIIDTIISHQINSLASSNSSDSLSTIENKHDVAITKQFVDTINSSVTNAAPSQNSSILLSANSTKQPRLFRVINSVLGIKNSIKSTKQKVSNAEVVVYLGQKEIFHLNN